MFGDTGKMGGGHLRGPHHTDTTDQDSWWALKDYNKGGAGRRPEYNYPRDGSLPTIGNESQSWERTMVKTDTETKERTSRTTFDPPSPYYGRRGKPLCAPRVSFQKSYIYI